jgi:hypothetical protein
MQLLRIEVRMEVGFRNVPQGLSEDRFERPFIDLVMERDGERLTATESTRKGATSRSAGSF